MVTVRRKTDVLAVFLNLWQRCERGRPAGRATFEPLFFSNLPFFVVPTMFAEKLRLAISFFNSSVPQNFKKLTTLARPSPLLCFRHHNVLVSRILDNLTTATRGMRVEIRENAGNPEVVFIFEVRSFFRNQRGLF